MPVLPVAPPALPTAPSRRVPAEMLRRLLGRPARHTAAAATHGAATADGAVRPEFAARDAGAADAGPSLPSLGNFRDLGGLPATLPCGRRTTTRHGVLFRSAAPSDITADDVGGLVSLGVRTVLDLRTDGSAAKYRPDGRASEAEAGSEGDARLWAAYPEAATEGDRRHVKMALVTSDAFIMHMFWKASWWGKLRLLALKLASRAAPPPWRPAAKRAGARILTVVMNRSGLLGLYTALVETQPARLAAVLRAAAESSHLPCLIHCTHGKDRTGVVAALLLLAAGVDRPAIVRDYELSAGFGRSEKAVKIYADNFPGIDIAAFTAAEGRAIAALMDEMAAAHGSHDAYFDWLGLDAAWRRRWQQAVLHDPGEEGPVG